MLKTLTTAVMLLATAGQQPFAVQFALNSKAPLLTAAPGWLGVNFDTASINHRLDLSDQYLRNLCINMGRNGDVVHLRVGGSAANSIQYIANAPTWGDNGHGLTILNDDFLHFLGSFQAATGVHIQWGIQYIVGDLSNAQQLLSAVSTMSAAGQLSVAGWSLGNELIGGQTFNSSQYAVDYVAFRKLVKSFPSIGQAVAGPSAPGFPGAPALTPFMEGVYSPRAPQDAALDEWSFHAYSFKNCTLQTYTDLPSIEHIGYYYSSYVGLRDAIAPGLPLYLEEFATQAGGGCANLSASFVSGFWYLHAMGMAGEAGIAHVTRQDLVGWSFDNGVSHYPLAGPPGWTNASLDGGSPLPHPDYFTTILWRQLMGSKVLNVSISSSSGGSVSQFALHAWCTSGAAGYAAGAVTLGYVNLQPNAVQLGDGAAGQPALVPRTEFIMTAVPGSGNGADNDAASDRAFGHHDGATASPPSYLLNDAVYLNGAAQPLALNADGTLQAYPLPGARVTDSTVPLVVPAYSYGFVVLEGAAAQACM